MLYPYFRCSLEICDCTGHFDDAVVSPGAQVKLLHGGFQHRIRGIIQSAVGSELFGTHLGIAMRVFVGFESDNSLNGTGTTSIWMSIRSNSGPEIFARYFCTTPGPHEHATSGWL